MIVVVPSYTLIFYTTHKEMYQVHTPNIALTVHASIFGLKNFIVLPIIQENTQGSW